MSQQVLREQVTLSFDGPSIRNHEMEVSTLAQSLIAFKDLAEHVNSFINKKNVVVAVKVHGGFKDGSFIVSLFVDCMAAILPQAPQMLSSIVNLINITKFLRGGKAASVEQADENMVMVNKFGEKATFNNCNFQVYNMANNASIKRDIANIARPFNAGVDSIHFTPSEESLLPVEIGLDDKDSFIPPDDDATEVDQGVYTLELLTPNFDGKAAGWRFFDPEDNVEFSANVVDEVFLQQVRDKHYNFQNGDLLQVEMTKTKKRIKQRNRTERDITHVLTHNRPDVFA